MSPEEAKQIPAIVPLEFWTDYEPVPESTDMKAVDWVRWVKKGTSNGATTEDKVARVERHNAAVWSVIEPYYKAWKKGEEAPVDGTPLDACPFVTREMVKALKAFHLRSAEDLAEAPDSALAKVGIPGIIVLRTKARAFVDAKKSEAMVAEKMAGVVAENERLVAELAELKATVQALSASLPKRAKPKDVAEKDAA